MLYFITGNKNKYLELKSIYPKLIQKDIDLEEIQEIDAKKIIEAKLKEAQKNHKGEFIIEDTSLYLDAFNGFPGPLIKWLLKKMSLEEIHKVLEKIGNLNAEAKTIIGYINKNKETYFFEASLKGRIVSPKGENGFGWDKIFKPENSEKTLAEMNLKEKNKISMRKKAFKKFLQFYNKGDN